ncbi:MAG TPA: Fur family transcriptional regulator [Stellaceae bacterium]|nr:Fur family transcriptional regulator [Stellaceae bacterium]
MKSAAFARAGHDHDHCVEKALDRADALCATQGARLTELRRVVLELVWRGHEPVGAYALLDALKRSHPNAAPPTIYRALDFLAGHGLIHRIESLNAYIGCDHPERPHEGQFLICARCSNAAEIDDPSVARALSKSASGLGFAVTRQTVELSGLCPSCQRGSVR